MPRPNYEKEIGFGKGCEFSEGNPCRFCPFFKCVNDLGHSDRIKFGMSWKKNDAVEWRKQMWQVQSAYHGSEELFALLEQGWEPFQVTPDGQVNRVWVKKNPTEQPEGSVDKEGRANGPKAH